jgi:hypothetical protein
MKEIFFEVLGYFTGEGSVGLFIAKMLFAYTAATVMIVMDVKTRDKFSTSTPVQFSRKFFWCDNLLRIWGNAVLIYFIILLGGDYFFGVITDENGELVDKTPKMQLGFAVLLGIVSDQIFFWAKRFKLLTKKKVRARFKDNGLSEEEQDEVDEN